MPPTATTSPFPPIAEYGFLSDCHTGALVAPDGSVDWLCLPAFDSASVFGNILDRGAGSFRFGPYGINVPTARTYVPGTNVLTTTWHTPGGWILVHDALVMGPRQGPDTVTPHTRAPADDDARHLLVRTVECLEGTVEVDFVCEPAFDYGRIEATWTLADTEGHQADAAGTDGTVFRLSTDMLIGVEGGAARARHVLSKGDQAFCALSWAEDLAGPADTAEATAHVEATIAFWRNWLARARIPDHPLRHPLERSALTIKGLTYMPTGATVAALTTSVEDLPDPENRVTLDRDGNVVLSYRANNQEPMEQLYHRVKKHLSRLGMHPHHLIPRDVYMKNDVPVAGCAHQAGTVRFGSDPETSVLDTDCKAHELDNLYVVDTGFFPSIGAVNPALTAMANALRVGDHVLARLG